MAAKEKATASVDDRKFTIPKLQKYAFELFGIPTSTFVGATADLEPDAEFTVEEVKEIIKEWSKKEAK